MTARWVLCCLSLSCTTEFLFLTTGLKLKDKEWLIEASMTANPPADRTRDGSIIPSPQNVLIIYVYSLCQWNYMTPNKSLWSGTNILMFIDLPDLNAYRELTLWMWEKNSHELRAFAALRSKNNQLPEYHHEQDVSGRSCNKYRLASVDADSKRCENIMFTFSTCCVTGKTPGALT